MLTQFEKRLIRAIIPYVERHANELGSMCSNDVESDELERLKRFFTSAELEEMNRDFNMSENAEEKNILFNYNWAMPSYLARLLEKMVS